MAIFGSVAMGLSVSGMSNGASLGLLRDVSNTLGNKGEGSKGIEVGDDGREDKSKFGLDADLGGGRG